MSLFDSPLGYFVVADFSVASAAGEKAKMYGPSFTSSSHCLTFWYQFETQDITLFRAMSNDTEEIIFSVIGKGKGGW